MATPSQPHPHPPSPSKPADPPKPIVEAEQKPPPVEPPVRTIVDEQREGSAEMEKVGVEEWKKKWYKGPRDPDHQQQVPGVRKDDEDEDDDGDDKSKSKRRY